MNFELDLKFGSANFLNFELNFRSSSKQFRFELKFRTRLAHHYESEIGVETMCGEQSSKGKGLARLSIFLSSEAYEMAPYP